VKKDIKELNGMELENKNLKKELELRNEELKALYSRLSAQLEFFAEMAHEIRTPLNGIVGGLDLLASTPLNNEQESHVEILRYSRNALNFVVSEILDFSRLESGEFKIEENDIDIRQIIKTIAAGMLTIAEQNHLAVRPFVSPLIPTLIKSDGYRIQQVLSNLTNNALKFTKKGEISVFCSLLDTNPQMLKFEVRDSGIGISPENQKNIFEKFIQAENSTSRKFGGTGLGLSIAKKIVTLLGGEIGVESELGNGSVFWFTVSFKKASLAYLSKKKKTKIIYSKKNELYNILLVEDNKINIRLATDMIRKFGYKVTIARNGQEALELIKNKKDFYNLVFMDLHMPIMGGLEATKYIREHYEKSIPIIAMTASVSSESRNNCMDAGMDDYMSKPFSINSLRDILDKWL